MCKARCLSCGLYCGLCMPPFVILHELLRSLDFPPRCLLCFLYKAMQQHNGFGLPGEIKDAGNIAGKPNPQFPDFASDVLDIRFFQRIAKLFQQLYFMESLGLVLGWQTV